MQRSREARNVTFAALPSEWERLKDAERLRKQREVDQRAAREAEVAGVATPETVAKLRRDVIQALYQAGTLTPMQHRAAQEIGRVWFQLCRDVMARSTRFEKEAAGERIEHWPASLSRAYSERYTPWREDTAGKQVVTGRLSVAGLVLMIVIDNYGIRQAADHLHMDQRTVLKRLREGLYRYGELAGWTDRPTAPANVGVAASL